MIINTENFRILLVGKGVCFCPLKIPTKTKKKERKGRSIELRFKLNKSFKQYRLFCGQKKLCEFSWRLHTLWSKTEGEGEQKSYAPKVLLPPTLTESSEAPNSSKAGWKFWMKDLSPNISSSFTVNCSFNTENSLLTNVLVVPIGKWKKVRHSQHGLTKGRSCLANLITVRWAGSHRSGWRTGWRSESLPLPFFFFSELKSGLLSYWCSYN